jgi:hypothetical protein
MTASRGRGVHQLSTDADLWHRLRDADESALAALYERHADAVSGPG